MAGSDHDFMMVEYYCISGTNREIGKSIAHLAKERGVPVAVPGDSLRTRLRYEYFRTEYPELYRRMVGVAEEYGISPTDFSRDASILPYMPTKGGCSVVFYPSDRTASGHNIVSRNLDMPIDGGMSHSTMFTRPIVFEVHPDSGYPCIYLSADDLLGGATEGINSRGLCVAVLGTESADYAHHTPEPSYEVGLSEFVIVRYLLDRCGTIDEARQSLLRSKQFYRNFQLHYVVADSSGKSFIFQFSRHRNQSRIVDGKGIQFVTNHLLAVADTLDAPLESVERFNILKSLLRDDRRFNAAEIDRISSSVSPWMPSYVPPWPGSRTLWHSVYDLNMRTLRVKFYLGESRDTSNLSRIITNYSSYADFQLN
ncbi:MAG TPA: C45 family peptidase [Bacteroidota bacterium]|nr:C45 family peptidase [Bacteroidota bacterium]